jgi:hypothetical protein
MYVQQIQRTARQRFREFGREVKRLRAEASARRYRRVTPEYSVIGGVGIRDPENTQVQFRTP